MRVFGLDLDCFEEMWNNQQGKCASCLTKFAEKRESHVDHCHDTGEVRALLCFSCNSTEGHLKKVQHILYTAFLDNIQHNLKLLKEK